MNDGSSFSVPIDISYDGEHASESESSAIWYDTSGLGDVAGAVNGTKIVAMAAAGFPSTSVDANITFHAFTGSGIPSAAVVAARDFNTVPGGTAGIGFGAV
jgi:hypothetical protein